jgi:hypothetical protein
VKFWPLLIAILGSGYYATWRYHCWFPVGAAALIGLLFWWLGFSVVGLTLAILLTLLVSPLIFAIATLLFIKLR